MPTLDSGISLGPSDLTLLWEQNHPLATSVVSSPSHSPAHGPKLAAAPFSAGPHGKSHLVIISPMASQGFTSVTFCFAVTMDPRLHKGPPQLLQPRKQDLQEDQGGGPPHLSGVIPYLQVMAQDNCPSGKGVLSLRDLEKSTSLIPLDIGVSGSAKRTGLTLKVATLGVFEDPAH